MQFTVKGTLSCSLPPLKPRLPRDSLALNQESKADLLISSVWRNRFLLPLSLAYFDASDANVSLFNSILVALPYDQEEEESVRIELPVLNSRYPCIKFLSFLDKGINASLLEALSYTSTSYLVLSVDDRIVSSINHQLFLKTLVFSIKTRANVVRLNNCGPHGLCSTTSLVAPLIKRHKYSISFTNTLFCRSFLTDLLSSEYTLWQLESFTPKKFLVGIYVPSIWLLFSPIISQSHVLRRGRIVSYARVSRRLALSSSAPVASPFFRLYHDLHALFYPFISTVYFGLIKIFSR